MYHPKDSLYFLHLPKTAGTSVTSWLRRYFKPDEFCPDISMAEIAGRSEDNLRQFRLFAGHFGWALPKRLPVQPVVICFFRHPVERVTSAYWYLRSLQKEMRAALQDDFARLQAEAASRLPLAEWIELPQAEYAIHNHMTWVLADDRAPTPGPFASAMRNLQKIDLPCLTEQMLNSFALITDRLGLPPSLESFRENVSPRPNAPSPPSITERILQLNELDHTLYQTAAVLFQESYQALALKLGRNPAKTRAATTDVYEQFFALEWHFLQRQWAGPRLRDGFVPADSEYFHTGWFPPVPSAINPGQILRWNSEQLAARLYLPLATDRPLQLDFNVAEIARVDFLDDLRLLVNGQPIGLVISAAPNQKFPNAHNLRAVIPTAVLQKEPHLTKLNFTNKQPNPYPNGYRPIAYRFLSTEESIAPGIGFSGLQITQL